MEQGTEGVLTDAEPIEDKHHLCKGSVKHHDYGTAYCDPAKGGCGMSRGVDNLWRS